MTRQIFPACTAFLFLILLIGCGPTRKEYAINEALLIDQTRMLEDQLYRAHFEIQHLQDENASLRRRLGEPEKTETSPVPFDRKNAEPASPPNQSLFPTGEAPQPDDPLPAIDGSYYQPPTTRSPMPGASRYRVAQRGTVRRALPQQGTVPYYPPQGGQVR